MSATIDLYLTPEMCTLTNLSTIFQKQSHRFSHKIKNHLLNVDVDTFTLQELLRYSRQIIDKCFNDGFFILTWTVDHTIPCKLFSVISNSVLSQSNSILDPEIDEFVIEFSNQHRSPHLGLLGPAVFAHFTAYYVLLIAILNHQERWMLLLAKVARQKIPTQCVVSLVMAAILTNNQMAFDLIISMYMSFEIASMFEFSIRNLPSVLYVWNPYYFQKLISFFSPSNTSLCAHQLLSAFSNEIEKADRHFITRQFIKFHSSATKKPNHQVIDKYLAFAKTIVSFYLFQSSFVSGFKDQKLFYQLTRHQVTPLWKQHLVPLIRDHPDFQPHSYDEIAYELSYSIHDPFQFIEQYQKHKVKINTTIIKKLPTKNLSSSNFFAILSRIESLYVLNQFVLLCSCYPFSIQVSVDYHFDPKIQLAVESYVDLHFRFYPTKHDIFDIAITAYPILVSIGVSKELIFVIYSYLVNSYVGEGQKIVESNIRALF